MTCLHSQVRSCWLKAEVTNAAAAGHQEIMLGEENVVLRGFWTLSVTFPAWVAFNTLLSVQKNPMLAPWRLPQVTPGCFYYIASLEGRSKRASQLSATKLVMVKKCSVPESFWVLPDVDHLFLLGRWFICLLANFFFFNAGLRIFTWRRGKGKACTFQVLRARLPIWGAPAHNSNTRVGY